jgi:perosamine synthetase
MRRHIPVAAPALVGNEQAYVLDCLKSTWISAKGHYIQRFEGAFSEFCGVRHAVSCSTGTAALHLALLALGIGPGDEVILPTLTYIATANAVAYCGARPVFVDSDPRTWNMDTSSLAEVVTSRSKAVVVVHLYGNPVDMDSVLHTARAHGLCVIEDAAQAHGAQYRGRRVGALGDIGTFSFYGSKILTTGQGGMVVTDDEELATRVQQLRSQGMDPGRRYWFPIVGYNYQMTNVAAAIGLAQLEKVEWHLARRRQIARQYRRQLRGARGISFQVQQLWARSAHWLMGLVLDEQTAIPRDSLIVCLAERGIETRPFFWPMHTLPMYQGCAPDLAYPVAERLAAQGLSLPSSATLTNEDVTYVCEQLVHMLGSQGDRRVLSA